MVLLINFGCWVVRDCFLDFIVPNFFLGGGDQEISGKYVQYVLLVLKYVLYVLIF